MGNIFARRPGRDHSLPPIAIGSHLDTQPTGGKYDGIIGVLGALEVLRTLNEPGYETNAPIEVIDWTNEEGSRFAPAMLSSGVFAGVFDARLTPMRARIATAKLRRGAGAHRLQGRGAVRLAQAGRAFRNSYRARTDPGRRGKTIGVVTGVQGMRWYEVTVTGMEAHAGATPMRLRRDALLGAGRMVAAINRSAGSMHRMRWRGGLARKPAEQPQRRAGRSVLHHRFASSGRHGAGGDGSEIPRALPAMLEPLAHLQEKRIWNSPAVHFAPGDDRVRAQRHRESRIQSRDMVSGAGHDAAYIARVAPTTMIFVPCAGAWHNEAEFDQFR